MNTAILLMFACMAIGFASPQLGKRTYILMGIAIIAYVVYAYRA